MAGLFSTAGSLAPHVHRAGIIPGVEGAQEELLNTNACTATASLCGAKTQSPDTQVTIAQETLLFQPSFIVLLPLFFLIERWHPLGTMQKVPRGTLPSFSQMCVCRAGSYHSRRAGPENRVCIVLAGTSSGSLCAQLATIRLPVPKN